MANAIRNPSPAGVLSFRLSPEPEGRLEVATGASPWWVAAEDPSPRRRRLRSHPDPRASVAPFRGSSVRRGPPPRARARGYQQSPWGLLRVRQRSSVPRPTVWAAFALGLLAIVAARPSRGLGAEAKKAKAAAEAFGAEPNPTGEPLGGGKGYRRAVTKGDFRASTLAELLDALGRAKAGQIVYVPDEAEIDMSGQEGVVIPGGVTLAGGRGRQGAAGGLLFSTKLKTFPLFRTGGDGVRVTGLRLRGPDPQRRTDEMRKLGKAGKYYSIPNSDGIQCVHKRLEVDNCELSGWSHAAVFLRKGSADAHIHHNHIHHNQRLGLGYGVCLDQAGGLIEANRFDWCRHHVAGTGRPGTSYEARYNLVGEHANGHSFDMHGGADRKDGTDVAGDRIRIHHNTFKATHVPGVVIRGRPRERCEVHHNWFLHAGSDRAVRQIRAKGNMAVGPNHYAAGRVER